MMPDSQAQQQQQQQQHVAQSQRQHGRAPASNLTRQRNIRIILSYTWIAFAGRSIWNQNVLATFCFLLEDGDPKSVGYLTAAMGICQLLVSFPVGYLADKYRRDHLLKVASCMGIVAAGTTLKVLFWNGHDHQPTYGGLIMALCLWGCFWGITNTCLSAVFADSMDQGERSIYFTQRSILINLGNLSGPTVALSMFLILGNEWTIMDCAYVMGAGQLICLPAMVLLCFLKDPQGQEDQESECNTDDEMIEQENSLQMPLLSNAQQQVEEDTRRSESSATTTDKRTSAKTDHSILVASADVLSGLASGMSIRYFAIFLYQNLHLKPVHVQILYILAPLLQAGLAKWGQVLAKSYGRCRVTVVYKWIGVSFMMAMVSLTHFNVEAIDSGNKWIVALICTLLVFRTAFMNSTSALTKSVLMDHVPNNERAKWSALESFNMFSWSGSAALGGILVDHHGILFNFCITASLQLVATLPHLLLARVAVRTNRSTPTDDETTNGGQANGQSGVDQIDDGSTADGQDRVGNVV